MSKICLICVNLCDGLAVGQAHFYWLAAERSAAIQESAKRYFEIVQLSYLRFLSAASSSKARSTRKG